MASAADSVRIIRNAPYRFHYLMRTLTTGQLLAGDSANHDVEISLASAAFADVGGAETEIGRGWYYVDLTAAEMTAVGSILLAVQTSTANTDEQLIELKPEACLDSGVCQASTSTTARLRSAASSTNDLYNGAIIELVRGTGAGQIRTIVDYVGSTTTATVDHAWITTPSTDSVYIIHPKQGFTTQTDGIPDVNCEYIDNNATAAANLEQLMKGGQINFSVNDAGATTTSFIGDSSLSSTNDFYNGSYCLFLTGTLAGLARAVSDYVGSTRTFTLATALPSAPANGVEGVVVGNAD